MKQFPDRLLVKQGMALRKEQGRFLVKVGSMNAEGGGIHPSDFTLSTSEVEVPIREVERVLVFGNVQLSTAVIGACLEAQIPVVFLSQLGDYKGHLWSAEFCDLPLEEAQFEKRRDQAFQMSMARSLVRGKLANSRQLLLRLNRKRQVSEVANAIEKLLTDIEALAQTDNLDSLRGYEGIGAARYFPAMGKLITNSRFSFCERNRRPPRDPVNSLLSFGYTLLFNNVMSLILAEGLNPYLGNLHRSERKNPHLVFDLMEEWRSPIVDGLVIPLLNRKALSPPDFSWPNPAGGVYLTEPARRVFLKAFEERISELTSHPDVQSQVSYRRAIQLQIQRYKRCVMTGGEYEPFLRQG